MNAAAMQLQRHGCGSHAVLFRPAMVLLGEEGQWWPVRRYAAHSGTRWDRTTGPGLIPRVLMRLLM